MKKECYSIYIHFMGLKPCGNESPACENPENLAYVLVVDDFIGRLTL